MLSIPRIYDKILIKRWKASIITDVLVWPQEFIDQLLGEAKVYYYDSAVPRAFSSGRFMADQYALNIIGKDALESARSKLFLPN